MAMTHNRYAQTCVHVALEDSSSVGEARREARALCDELGLDDARCGRVALAVTESATNVVRHAQAPGLITMRIVDVDARLRIRGLQMLVLDQGVGMSSIGDCLRDGFSTGGSRGVGLGAIVRQSDVFDLYSRPGQGTALLMEIHTEPELPLDVLVHSPAPTPQRPFFGVISVPSPGEAVSGDGWAVVKTLDHIQVLVVDGLGHGPKANIAAIAARETFLANPDCPPAEMMSRLDAALRTTRGAVAAVCEVDLSARTLQYSGVGNISGTLLTATTSAGLVSHHGTLGKAVRRTSPFVHDWLPGSTLVLHSDGVSRRWQFDDYPGLSVKHPALIAGVLYRDFQRGRDDAVVVVVRDPTPEDGVVSGSA